MDNSITVYKLVRNDDGHLCSLAALGRWQIVYEPGTWKRGGAGSKLFAVSHADLACQYGKIERGHFRLVEVWEALAKEVGELGRFLTMDRSRWEAFWSGANTGLWHNPPAGTVLVGQIKLVRKVWPED
jgi:hypothetical protein